MAREQVEHEFDIVRLVKRLRQTEGLLYSMTTKGQRRLARWQARHVMSLEAIDEMLRGHHGANVDELDDDTDDIDQAQ